MKSSRVWPWLGLFTSFGTLLCCALPALLVALGAGALLAQVASTAPGLVWLSAHKEWVFALSGIMLALAGASLWHARRLPCPLDAAQAQACSKTRAWSNGIYAASLLVYALGAWFAYFQA